MSHKNIKNVSLDAVFVELIRRGFDETDEKDVVEWSGKALEAIGAITQYEEAVCFSEVRNHQVTLPIGFHSIIQLARNHCHHEDNPGITAYEICHDLKTNTLPQPFDTEHFVLEGGVPVPIDMFGEPIDEYQLAYYRPYFDLQYEYSPWVSSTLYRSCFTPIRLTTHSFFNSLVCKEEGFDQIYHHGITDEYNIYGGDTLRLSFEKGQVAIAYTRSPLDPETGYPLIPDNVSYITAIIYYIIWKLMEKDFYRGTQGAEGRMREAEKQWIWYCRQAGNKSLMIEGEDEHQNFMDGRQYLLPRLNRYNGFFGKLGSPENRKFNNPDFKNSRVSLFRGMQ